MKCILISDKEMQDYLKHFNESNGSNYSFIWCPEYCNLVDFTNHHRLDYNNSLQAILYEFKYDNIELKAVINLAIEEGTPLSDVCGLYHDTSRKTYILTWN